MAPSICFKAPSICVETAYGRIQGREATASLPQRLLAFPAPTSTRFSRRRCRSSMKKQPLNPEYSLHDEVVASILVVEDDPEINALMALTLRVEEYEVLQARDGQQALKILAEQTPDLILMDVMMPRISGYELARVLQEQSATRHIPIIFVTAKSEMEDRVRGLEMAIDYVCKPFAAPELIARVRVALRMSRLQEQLRASNQKLAQLATTDSLTGLCNRRHFYLELENEIQRAARFGQALSLVIFDLDHFKHINDSWGHAQGDQVLQKFARALDDARRHIDTVARLGGEEFIALLPSTNLEGARTFAEKVRQTAQDLHISCHTFDGDEAPSLQITVSAGAATLFLDAADGLRNTLPEAQRHSDKEHENASAKDETNAVDAAAFKAGVIDIDGAAQAASGEPQPAGHGLARALASAETAESSGAKSDGSTDSSVETARAAASLSPSGQELMRVADRSLYQSKALGRNRVTAEVVAPFSPAAETPIPKETN